MSTWVKHLEELDVLVVGGGVSGMYCAWKLAERGRQVSIVEALDRWGGRMETVVMDGFIAEYGPMRFEPHLQPRFAQLIKDLELELVPFTGPSAPRIDYPQYDLLPAERGLTSLDILRRGILLIMGRTLAPDDPAGRRHQEWMDSLTEEHYRTLRRTATQPGNPSLPLWQTGFWNALSAPGVLSHQALMMLRDTGTFYHMLPDNLNAVEWTIWWLRALKTDGAHLASVQNGTSRITDGLVRKMTQSGVRMGAGVEVTALRPGADGRVEVSYRHGDVVGTMRAREVVLALPQAPLKKLSAAFPSQIQKDLESVNGFPMVKVFFVSSKPWWDGNTRPQTRANRMPTREVHYFRRPAGPGDDGHGMVLIYTDRPASEYWKLYVKGEVHDRAELNGDPELKRQFARWLAADAKEAAEVQTRLLASGAEAASALPLRLTSSAMALFAELSLDDVAQHIEGSVVTFGIRDWARPPYGAANHSWHPNVKSWEVMDRFSGFSLIPGGRANVHICGEAYSDYSGFIEGALNTAQLALDSIPTTE